MHNENTCYHILHYNVFWFCLRSSLYLKNVIITYNFVTHCESSMFFRVNKTTVITDLRLK